MIKKFLSIGFAVVFGISAFAQATVVTTVPAQVSTAFQAQNPGVTHVTWTQDGAYFLPAFTVGGVDNIGYIDLKGHYIQTIATIAIIDLPATASIYISQNYQGKQVTEVGKINFPNNTFRYYAKVGGKQLLFDNAGKFLKLTESFLKQ